MNFFPHHWKKMITKKSPKVLYGHYEYMHTGIVQWKICRKKIEFSDPPT